VVSAFFSADCLLSATLPANFLKGGGSTGVCAGAGVRGELCSGRHQAVESEWRCCRHFKAESFLHCFVLVTSMVCLLKLERSDVINAHLNLCLVCGRSIEVRFVNFNMVANIRFSDGQNIEWYGELNCGL
jgi:hypothetical protein